MKVVIQRVKKASVTVDREMTGAIGKGLLLLVGIHGDDTTETMQWICDKILKMRIFDDEEGKMNLSLQDVGGELLVVPQFTLYGDAEKGNRPSFIEAAGPEKAEKMYDQMVEYFNEQHDQRVATGRFAAYMNVESINDGPVTIILEK
ncbi:MAG: D-aminoacyl-tRNA deacylase [Balneolaceae bacterium]|nr:D-aminoacyl-tRNA deacylase [Balneolaceae bacterium]